MRLLKEETVSLMTRDRLSNEQRATLVREESHWSGQGFGLGLGIDIDAEERARICPNQRGRLWLARLLRHLVSRRPGGKHGGDLPRAVLPARPGVRTPRLYRRGDAARVVSCPGLFCPFLTARRTSTTVVPQRHPRDRPRSDKAMPKTLKKRRRRAKRYCVVHIRGFHIRQPPLNHKRLT